MLFLSLTLSDLSLVGRQVGVKNIEDWYHVNQEELFKVGGNIYI